MFSKKSREVKQQAAEDARTKVIMGLDDQLLDAHATSDPADRLLKLTEVAAAADVVSANATRELCRKADTKFLAPYLGISLGGAASCSLVAILMPFPPALTLLIPALLLGGAVGGARATRTEKKYREDTKPFFDKLTDISDTARESADQLVRDHLRELSASPKSGELLQRVPRLCDKFAEAFMKAESAQLFQFKQPVEPPPTSGKNTLKL